MRVIFDVILFLLLSALPGSVAMLANRKKSPLSRKEKFIYALIGLYVSVTCILLKYLGGNGYYQFSPLHIYLYIFAVMTPFVLYYLVRNHRRAIKGVSIAISVLLFLVVVSRFVTWPLLRNESILLALPFNPCTIVGVILLPAVIFNIQSLKNLACSLGFVGGFSVMYFGFNDGVPSFWGVLALDSYLLHMLLVTASIFLIMTGEVKLDYRYVIKALYFFVPFYIGIVFLNGYLGTNFFFTKPMNSTVEKVFSVFPQFNIDIVQIHLVYFISCLAVALGLCILVTEFFRRFLYPRKRLAFDDVTSLITHSADAFGGALPNSETP